MDIHWERLNWLAILVCVVVGQAFLTVWFSALFGRPWARAYGVDDTKRHTQEIPGYTYAIGLACTLLVTVGLAILQAGLGVKTAGAGLVFGFFVAVHFCVATAVPGYAFLKRWNAAVLAVGSQAVLILSLSLILAVWQKS